MGVDYKSYPVLYVDDESNNLVTFRYAMEDRFEVITATSGADALEVLKTRDVAVLLADQRMPGMTGVELCEQARIVSPDTVRIIITAYSDVHAAVTAINRGHVSRYLAKPWSNDELVDTLQTCIDLVHVQHGMRDLEQRLLWGGQAHVAAAARHQLTHDIGNHVMSALKHAEEEGIALRSVESILESVDLPEARHALSLLREAQERHDSVYAALDLLSGITERYQGRSEVGAALEPDHCDPARVIDAALRIVRDLHDRDTRMSIVIEQSPLLAVPPSVLGQVMLNLLMNALEALASGGGTERSIEVRVDLDGELGIVSVADSGPGIAAEHMPRIFEPYFTTKPDGTGLGLSIVRDLVERAGGSVRVRSHAGTVVELRFPRAEDDPASPRG